MPKLGKNKGKTHTLKPNDGHLNVKLTFKWKGKKHDKHEDRQKESVHEVEQD